MEYQIVYLVFGSILTKGLKLESKSAKVAYAWQRRTLVFWVFLLIKLFKNTSGHDILTLFLFITYHRVSLVWQELLTIFKHLRSSPIFSGVRVTWSLVFYAMSCRSLFVMSSFIFWSLCCFSFFDLRILITPLVSSNPSNWFLPWQMVTNVLFKMK